MENKKAENYELVLAQAKSLLTDEFDVVANMSNLSSLIFYGLPNLNSVTFYRLKNNELIVGPFQGKPACIHIPIGSGVCGTVAKNEESEIVPDVTKFKGHIACDSASRSEIVVPIFKDNKFCGVLDLDSPKYETFDETDEKYLSQIAQLIFGYKDN